MSLTLPAEHTALRSLVAWLVHSVPSCIKSFRNLLIPRTPVCSLPFLHPLLAPSSCLSPGATRSLPSCRVRTKTPQCMYSPCFVLASFAFINQSFHCLTDFPSFHAIAPLFCRLPELLSLLLLPIIGIMLLNFSPAILLLYCLPFTVLIYASFLNYSFQLTFPNIIVHKTPRSILF